MSNTIVKGSDIKTSGNTISQSRVRVKRIPKRNSEARRRLSLYIITTRAHIPSFGGYWQQSNRYQSHRMRVLRWNYGFWLCLYWWLRWPQATPCLRSSSLRRHSGATQKSQVCLHHLSYQGRKEYEKMSITRIQVGDKANNQFLLWWASCYVWIALDWF